MRNIFIIPFLIGIAISCSGENKKMANSTQEDNIPAPYDTIAIDSFSNGAISIDVADRIRRSSVAYQDSVNEALEKQKMEKEAKRLAEEQAKVEKEVEKKKENAKPTSETATQTDEVSKTKEPNN